MTRIPILKNGSGLSAFVLFLCLLILPIQAQTETFNVTNEDELRVALSTAESNGEDDTINIAAGVYHTNGETFTFESDEDFSMTIEGDGAGLTILEGGGMSRVLKINANSHADIFVSISGFTIQNGFHISIPDDMSNSDGAGIYVTSQNVMIQDCQFINNNVSRGGLGGGLYASARSVLILSGNLFSQNSAAFSGGGIYVVASEITMSDNEFIGNTAELGDGGGAYIYNQNFNIISASITNNIFISNESGAVSHMGSGGGLGISACCLDIDYVITNNSFTLNTAGENGGGISFSATLGEIPPPPGGGDFVVGFAVLNVYNNIIYGNFASGNGEDLFITKDSIIGQLSINLFNSDYSNLFIACGSQFDCPPPELLSDNNLDEDPLFVDVEAGDLSLQPDSPCIDAGDPSAPDLPPDDILGNPRGPVPDIGAVEYIEIVDGHGGNGGCALTNSPATSSLAVFMAIPVLILIRRLIKKQRRT